MRLIDADALMMAIDKIEPLDDEIYDAVLLTRLDVRCAILDAPTIEPSDDKYILKGVYDQVRWERDMALETLEEHGIGLGQKYEPSGDLISRADAIEAVVNMQDGSGQTYEFVREAMFALKALPSADAVKVAYFCDGRKCNEDCSECCRTFDIEHARDFKRIGGTYYQQESAEAEWIPFKKRPLTDEEKQEYPDWTYIFDCPLPDDEEEILLSNGKYVWTDTFINDGECYLDGGDDIDDGMAWMPLPKPYKGGDTE